MKNGRFILKAKLDLLSPLLIGSGKSDISDRDVLLDSEGEAYIPATSFLGVLSRQIDKTVADSFLGHNVDRDNQPLHQSYLICDDLHPISKDTSCVVRDGIRLNSESGLVENSAKFDFQVIEPGLCFTLNLEFIVTEPTYEEAKQVLANCLAAMQKPIYIGGKTSSGFGCLRSKDIEVYQYDFEKEADLAAFLLQKPTENIIDTIPKLEASKPEFKISADFRIPQSLIVRSYPKDAYGPDAVHIHSAKRPVLPGTSLRGALRARAERILGIIWSDQKQAIEDFIASIFGFASTSGKQYTVPSFLRVDECPMAEVGSEVQNRIRIDRFTGGTIEGAKFDSMPIFPRDKDSINIRSLNLSLSDPLPSQKALLLLLLKDLYTEDLPIGGEKGIGRGILQGVNAQIQDEDNTYRFEKLDQQDLPDAYQDYLKALLENKDREEIQNRLAVFRQKGANNEQN